MMYHFELRIPRNDKRLTRNHLTKLTIGYLPDVLAPALPIHRKSEDAAMP
jgi:hypothetical protein